MTSLYELALASASDDPVTKPPGYYKIYDRTLEEEGLVPRFILEIGVYKGESTRILARRFPNSRIVALDLRLAEIDFAGYPQVSYLQCDQTDGARLEAICREHFPSGIDLVIEDAAHIGQFSAISFRHVFPYLNSNGLYIVEDWGTGYWPSWVDGARYEDPRIPEKSGRIQKSIPSHDSGMVGFVKSLVDFTAVADIADTRARSGSLLSRLLVMLSGNTLLRDALEQRPALKSWCLGILDRDKPKAKAAEPACPVPGLPQLASVKFFRGVCVARKA